MPKCPKCNDTGIISIPYLAPDPEKGFEGLWSNRYCNCEKGRAREKEDMENEENRSH
jgi:hypothetical protein